MTASESKIRDARTNATSVAVAASTAIGAASMRVLIPEIYRLREDAGLAVAAGVALLTFASPVLAGAVRRGVGARRAIVAVLVAQAVAWMTLRLVHPIRWPLAALATGCALIGWTQLLYAMRSSSPAHGTAFTLAFVLGLTLDTSIHAMFRTWDVSWQDGAASILTASLLAVGLVIATSRSTRSSAPPAEGAFARSLSLAGLGLALVLATLFLQNVAFVDSVTGGRIAGGSIVVLAADLAAVAGLIRWHGMKSRGVRALGGVVLVVAAWLLTSGDPVAVVLSMIAGSVVAAQLLAAALSADPAPPRATAWRTSLAVALGGVAFVLCVLLYQIHVTNPMPVSNRWIPVLASALLGLAALGRRTADEPLPARAIWVPALLLVLTPALLLTRAAPGPVMLPAEGVTRVMDWNVHSAIGGDGMLDPRALADEILRQNATIVVLQEVPRGWTIAGTIDLGEWLADETGMSMAWAPAADGQFGNVILSREPITSSEVIALPYGAGPQHRSALRVGTTTWDGTPLNVVGTHLESKAGTSTGADQVRTILDDIGTTSPAIVAGDMNMQPDNPDVQLFADAGFVSAQDATGHGTESTSRDPTHPGDRVDWIFGRSVTFDGFRIVRSSASDHLPLVVVVGP